MIDVTEFIKEHALFHSEMTYNTERKSFNLDPYENKDPGIYFILDKEDILKIGKADGKQGLKGRISTYRTRLVKNFEKGDSTVLLWNKVMTDTLNETVLSIYLLPLQPHKITYKGIEVEMLVARSLEYELSKLASIQGHSMLLSGQN
jgi:hypothetical protein